MERDKQTPDLNLVFFLVRRSPLRVSPLVQVSDTFGLDRSTSERKQETSRWSSSRFVINISLGTPSEGNRSGRIKENGFPRMETERSFSLSLSLSFSLCSEVHSFSSWRKFARVFYNHTVPIHCSPSFAIFRDELSLGRTIPPPPVCPKRPSANTRRNEHLAENFRLPASFNPSRHLVLPAIHSRPIKWRTGPGPGFRENPPSISPAKTTTSPPAGSRNLFTTALSLFVSSPFPRDESQEAIPSLSQRPLRPINPHALLFPRTISARRFLSLCPRCPR